MYDQEKKADAGKDRWDLLPMNQIQKVVKVLTDGAEKYGDNGWRKVEPERFFAAMMRHIYSWRYEQKKDKESGMNHMIHVICNAIFLAENDEKLKEAFSDLMREHLKIDKPEICLGMCDVCGNNIFAAVPDNTASPSKAVKKCRFNVTSFPNAVVCNRFKEKETE